MKKFSLVLLLSLFAIFQINAQCTFESLFPIKWGGAKYAVNEYYNASPLFQKGNDTIRGSVFQHGLDYWFTGRNLNLTAYSYTNIAPHPCFMSGDIVVNCITSDSGLVAYNYQVTYPASRKNEFQTVIDSMRSMMKNQFTYTSAVDNKTAAMDASGIELTGEGVSVYFNDQPIVHTNLTYPQMVIRGGYLAKKPAKSSDPKVMINQAEDVQYYRIEILYKRAQPKW
jgi:hypothetical protein